MSSKSIPFLAFALLVPGSIRAAIPQSGGTDTRGLIENSPFTSKPQVRETALTNPLDDYSLIGVSPISADGFRVTLALKKNPTTRITVETGETGGPFEILEVLRGAESPIQSSVRLRMDSYVGTIAFDPSFLKPALPAAPKPESPVRTARPRVTPPAH